MKHTLPYRYDKDFCEEGFIGMVHGLAIFAALTNGWKFSFVPVVGDIHVLSRDRGSAVTTRLPRLHKPLPTEEHARIEAIAVSWNPPFAYQGD